MENMSCDLCGSDQKQPYIEQADRFSGKVFSLVRCSNCGLIYLDERPNQDELAAYYPDDYEAFSSPAAGDGDLSDLSALKPSLDRQLDFVERVAPGRGQLLDVGCATGNFMRIAQSRGWEATGIELSDHAYNIARNTHKLNVIKGTLASVPLPLEKFDAVTFWDVLEHLPSPKAALKTVHKLLKPNGIVIFSIPNLISFDRYIFKSHWIGWDTPRHFTLLDQATTKALLGATQFSLLGSKCVTGGKGTLFLSLDNLLKQSKRKTTIEKLYPLIGMLHWPYRQISYYLNRAPIITYAAQKNAGNIK